MGFTNEELKRIYKNMTQNQRGSYLRNLHYYSTRKDRDPSQNEKCAVLLKELLKLKLKYK